MYNSLNTNRMITCMICRVHNFHRNYYIVLTPATLLFISYFNNLHIFILRAGVGGSGYEGHIRVLGFIGHIQSARTSV